MSQVLRLSRNRPGTKRQNLDPWSASGSNSLQPIISQAEDTWAPKPDFGVWIRLYQLLSHDLRQHRQFLSGSIFLSVHFCSSHCCASIKTIHRCESMYQTLSNGKHLVNIRCNWWTVNAFAEDEAKSWSGLPHLQFLILTNAFVRLPCHPNYGLRLRWRLQLSTWYPRL